MVLNSNSKQDLENFKSYILVEKNFSKHTAKGLLFRYFKLFDLAG